MKKLFFYVLEILGDEKCQKIFFQAVLICFVGVSFYSALYGGKYFMDTTEHIHASYLVSIGKIPYKDFFEHHNPLLWYLFAPIAKIFYRNPIILPVAQNIGVCGYLAVIWLVYKINKRFIYEAKAAKLCLIILITVPYLWVDIATLRPDIFMLLCFLGAVYYFLDYLTKKSKIKLILSYSLLGLSFLFLQKIVLLGFGFIVVNLYYLHSKQIRLPDFVLAVVCAMSPLILFFSYLLYNEIADDWFYYNFTFNMLLKKYYDGYTSGFGFLLPIWCLGSFFIVLRYYKWEKRHILIAVLYFLSVVTTVLFAPHAQYFVLYFIFASIFLGNILLNAKYFKLLYLSLMLFSFIAFFTMLPSEKSKIGYLKHFGDISATLKYADANKSVLSLNKVSCNLFNQSPFYYWFGFHNVAIIDAIYNPQKNLI